MRPELKVEKGKLILIKKLDKEETYKVNEQSGIFTLSIFKKPQWTKGVTSMCGDMKHILMLDYDGICRWIVEKELEILSKEYAPFYLFKTKEEIKNGELVGNYHGVCLQKFTPNEIVEIQRKTSIDLSYMTMPLRSVYRNWCLRQSEKKGSGNPEFIKVIGNSNLDKEISSPHLLFLSNHYKIPHIDYKNKDKLEEIYFNTYETGV